MIPTKSNKLFDGHTEVGDRVVPAYLVAVTTASAVLVLAKMLPEIPSILVETGFESATFLDKVTKFQHLVIMASLLFVIGWIFTLFAAFLPFAIGISIANHLNIKHWLYYLLGGTLAAIAIEPLVISIPNLGFNVIYPEPSFEDKYVFGLPYFLAAGSAAGVLCFIVLRKGFKSGAQL